MTVKDYADKIQTELGEYWLPKIYQDRVLKLRTRAYQFDNVKRGVWIEIQHTLLGVELKIGRKRLLCPDLATARYLSVFARAGCRNVALPYDITKISHLADQLESSWYRMLLLVDYQAVNESERFRNRLRSLLTERVEKEVAGAGVGTKAF